MSESALFEKTPFTIVADDDSGKHWAGRPEELRRIHRIVKRLGKRDECSLDVIWANFGAGKSHTLFYLSHQLETQNAGNVCVIIEIPEQVKNFLELYQRIARKLPFDFIAGKLLECDRQQQSDDLQKAARAIEHGGAGERDLAIQWLSGERPDLRKLRQAIGIGTRIEKDAIAADTLSSIIHALNTGNTRLCIMLDEFQRIGKLSERSRSQINSSLRTLLTKNPRNFSLFFAISSKIEQTAMNCIPEELRSIMGMQKPVTLPTMDETEAVEFVRDRMRYYRPKDYQGDDFAPLGDVAVKTAVKKIVDSKKVDLIPRTILQTLGYLYDEIDETNAPLDQSEVQEILEDLNWNG